MQSEVFMNDRQLAARWGVHRGSVWRWAKNDQTFPKPLKIGGAARWRLSEIEAWEAQRAAA